MRKINNDIDASLRLSEWIKSHSNPLKDPWEDPSYADETDVSDNPKLIDPTSGKSDYVELCHGKNKRSVLM